MAALSTVSREVERSLGFTREVQGPIKMRVNPDMGINVIAKMKVKPKGSFRRLKTNEGAKRRGGPSIYSLSYTR